MTVLINKQIKARLGSSIIIEPFNDANLNTCSYDVTIGPWVWRIDQSKNGLHFQYLEASDSIFLNPKERILAATNEFIGGRYNVVPEMRARSTTGRMGLTVCSDAGWGDIGFCGRWTMEVMNLNPMPISIPIGARFAQIVFHHTEEIDDDTSYDKQGRYAPSFEWKPEDMLPKGWK